MRIVIIGGGIAGNTVASAIRRYSPKSQITLVSEETYPLYSACVLPHYLAGKLNREKVFLKNTKGYAKERIKTIFGEKVEDIDVSNRQVNLSNQSISYDKLIIATGGKVIIPSIRNLNKEGVFNFKSLADADKIYKWSGERAVVIGSGLIGIEVAMALKKRDYQVCVVELLDWILPQVFDEQPALLLKELMERNGVEILVGERVNSINGKPKVTHVITDKREIECDTVILATGIKPNVELAQKSKLKIGRLGGIEVNKQMATSLGDVYACGDCVETKDSVSGEEALNLLWHNAKQQAEIAANNCLGNSRKYYGSINITGVDIFDVQATSIGLNSTSIKSKKGKNLEIIEKKWGNEYLRLIIYGESLVGVQGINRTKDMSLLLSSILRSERLKIAEENADRLFPYLWRRHRINEYYR